MKNVGILAIVEAKSGKESAVSDFLKSALALAQSETLTLTWYAFQINHNTFGIFDSFETDEGRDAHLGGPIAAALMANADVLLSKAPSIQKVDLLAVK